MLTVTLEKGCTEVLCTIHVNVWCEITLKEKARLPWWHSGWESACQHRGHGFEPWSRKIPHATEQIGPRATTTEPVCHNY